MKKIPGSVDDVDWWCSKYPGLISDALKGSLKNSFFETQYKIFKRDIFPIAN
jgi:hypothetical protein